MADEPQMTNEKLDELEHAVGKYGIADHEIRWLIDALRAARAEVATLRAQEGAVPVPSVPVDADTMAAAVEAAWAAWDAFCDTAPGDVWNGDVQRRAYEAQIAAVWPIIASSVAARTREAVIAEIEPQMARLEAQIAELVASVPGTNGEEQQQ